MKFRSILLIAVSAVACWSTGPERADASQVLFNGVGFMQGTQSFSDSFTLSSPGTLTVTLSNVAWPQPLASLQLLMTSASGKLGPEMSATTSTTSTFNAESGEVFANWFGTAQGGLNAGVYSLEIQFQPNGSSGNTVPLPTSIGLLLSGLGLLIWQRRIKVPGADRVLEESREINAT
jgi:hypothetical protein